MRPGGFTLTELLVTLALVAIMLTLAAPSMQKILANQRLSAAASDFMATAMQARSAALKYNQRVVAQPIAGQSGAWAEGWRIYVDSNLNSTFDSGTDTLVLTQEAMLPEISISKVSGVNNFFAYNGTGFLASIGGSADATWKIESTATNRKKFLIVERSGRARLCDPTLATDCPPP